MKSAIFLLSLFTLGSLATAVPAEDTTLEARTTYKGTCTVAGGPGMCHFKVGGKKDSKPCGVNYKCKVDGEPCDFNTSGGHAHCDS
ncbi:MAG: hypothetical protein M1828_001918 [Chrysothrix sp. TS-e1954]|nr:MAG: hypothetical protein M1828_001918 [Chrysothrix sp. TS-e1954]